MELVCSSAGGEELHRKARGITPVQNNKRGKLTFGGETGDAVIVPTQRGT